MAKIINVKNLTKTYSNGRQNVNALEDVSFDLDENESMVILGPSGSGKSTMLHMIGALDKPTSGEIEIAGKNIKKMKDDELSIFRNKTIGFVFQFFYLQEYLTAKENVALPMIIGGTSKKIANEKADKFLEDVNLKDRMNALPGQMSGGEMQRVAVARALVNNPRILLADEPTGNLDRENAETVMELFDKIANEGVSVVVITHDQTIGDKFNKVVKINKGKVEK